jgi:N-acetylglucosamine-6-phosphate deacetylase
VPTVVAADSLVTGGPVHAPGAVTIDGSTITAVAGTVPERVDVRVAHLVPGFVDIRTHGAGGATHLFNPHAADPPPRARADPALLRDPRMHVELIADGVHVHPAVMAMVRRAVPAEHIVLVTDAMEATGWSSTRTQQASCASPATTPTPSREANWQGI